MLCVSACKISIPEFSASPEPRQEEEALHAAQEIESLSAEASFFPLARGTHPRPMPNNSLGMGQNGCAMSKPISNNMVGDEKGSTMEGRTSVFSDSPDLSLQFFCYDVPPSGGLRKGLSPAITFLPRSHSFPPIRCTPATSNDGGSPERTQDSFPIYSPPNPADLVHLRFPAGFVVHTDKTPPLDCRLNAWLSPKRFALNSPPPLSSRMHRYVEESPTHNKAVRRKPVPRLSAEDLVRNSSFMRFSTMKSFPLIRATDSIKPSPSVVAKVFRRCDRVNGYSLRCFLSQGAQGKVYLATSGEGREKLTAIKVISKVTVECFRTLLQEQKLLKRIKGHRFVLNMVDSFHDTENFYLVTDYYPGGDLSNLLYKLGVFETDMARFYISELIVAVNFLHDKEIVHRDLKPGNILIKSDGHICLVDFGLCKDFKGVSSQRNSAPGRLSPQTGTTGTRRTRPVTNGFAGTLVYMSPQAVNQDPYSYETDWWAMGIILYELLQGDTPWVGSDIPSMVRKIQRDPLVFRKDVEISPVARDFIEKLLQKEVKSRIPPSEFEGHNFFQSAKFADVQAGLLTPPFTPLYDQKALASGFLKESDKIYVGRSYDPTADPFPEYNYTGSLASSSPVVNVPALAKLVVDKSLSNSPTDSPSRPPACTRSRKSGDHRERGPARSGSVFKLLNLPIGSTLARSHSGSANSTQAAKSSLLPRIASSLFKLSAAFSRSVSYSDHFAGTTALDAPPPAMAVSPPPAGHAHGTPLSPSIAHPSSRSPPAPAAASKSAKASPLQLPAPSLTPPLPSMLTVSSIRSPSSLFSVGMDGSATHTTILSSYTTSLLADSSALSAAGSSASHGITEGAGAKKQTSASPLLGPEASCKGYESRRVGTLSPSLTSNTSAATGLAKWIATATRSFVGFMKRIRRRFKRNPALQNILPS